MTFDEFKRLRRGDVIIWKRRTFRVIQSGPGDMPRHRSKSKNKNWVHFAKLKNSYIHNAQTLYNFNEIGHFIYGPVEGISGADIFEHEKKRLRVLGFNLWSEACRQAREIRRVNSIWREWHPDRPYMACDPTGKSLLDFSNARGSKRGTGRAVP